MKRILVACEFSGTVRDAFAAKGWDAWSCDLLPSETGGQHFQCDAMEVLNRDWDLIMLHPPCTKIALCGNSTYGKGMPKHAERAASLDWTESIWRKAVAACPCVGLENPKNVLGARIGKRTQVIQPWQFGHLEQKETWFWLHGLPRLKPTRVVFDEMMKLPRKERERIHFMSPGENRGHERSRTFTGIAAAMAEQWSIV